MKNLFLKILILSIFLTSCGISENIQDGTTAFNLKKYNLASELLTKEFNKEQLPEPKAKLAYMIAQSYQYNNDISNATQWYKTAIEWEYGSEAILAYAKMLKSDEKYEEAIQQFEAYLKEEPYRRPEINTEISMCKNAVKRIADQNDEFEKDTYITNLASLNSSVADFNPTLHNNKLFFTSSRESSTGDKTDKWTTQKYYDIYVSERNGISDFSKPELFTTSLNTNYNDGSLILSADGNELFFTRCGSEDKKKDDYCGLYFSSMQTDGTWSEATLLPFFSDSVNIGTPCLSPDGQLLFFAATDPDGYGGSDIYFSKRLLDGWDAPVNAGTVINTNGNEVFPSFSPDGIFYFASDGHPGIGGLDIFSAKFVNGKFSKVINMEYPLNSGADDFSLIMLDKKQFQDSDTIEAGYFSSARKGGLGSDDLYLYVKKKKKLRPAVYVLDGSVMEKVYADSLNPESAVLDTIPLKNAIATLAYPELLTLLNKFSLKEKNTFSVELDSNKLYKITAAKDPDYFSKYQIINTADYKANAGDTVHIFIELVLDRIFETAEIKLNNIYYDYNSAKLRAESFPELDKLVTLLKENPSIQIQLNSHTDSRGSDSYNLKLSQARAQSVVDYLVQNGITAERLTAKGYGETEPVNKCVNGVKCTEEEHQLNRRTTFKVKSERLNIESETPDEIKVDEAPENIRDDTPKLD